MIYLMGLNHNLQHDGISSAPQKSRETLLENMLSQVKHNKIQIIAEEANQEFLDRYRATESTAQRAARLCCIPHRFCDPDLKERELLGVPNDNELALKLFGRKIFFNAEEDLLDAKRRKYYSVREQFWYERIKDITDRKILFVCGEFHINSFQKMLRNKGRESEILCGKWEK